MQDRDEEEEEEEEEGIRVMNYGHANALPVKETAQRPFYSLP